ncbi:MFS transporter [Geomonas limicola]|uniref:MFS transporter n=1 Tax=Geomonas limicola TaxID=2740186 RepID=A0A6V8N5V8_9BACT|nr:MFS transporter [Geomonas limicola]GFO67780.1 MFS transporter [Geomonas limicola]
MINSPVDNRESDKSHYGYVIVLCMALIMGVNVGLVMSSAGIFYQPVSRDLGVSVGKLGLYMSFNFLSSSLMLSIAGRLMDKYSARMLLTLSSAVLGFTVGAMGLCNAVWQFYIAGSVIGITLSFLLYLSFPTMINRWFKSRVGFFIGICSAASGIGGILFNPMGGYLITHYGWRSTYMLFGGVILLLVTPLIGLLLRNYPEDIGLQPHGANMQHVAVSGSGVEYSNAIRMPVFYGLIVFAFLMISISTLNLFIPKYVTSLNYTLEQASFAASAVMAGVTIGKVVLGMINDKNSLLGVAATVAGGIAGLALLLIGHVGIWAVTAGGFLFGWAYAGVTVETPMLVRAVFGDKDYAKIYSNISIAFAVGGAITAGGWGLLADFTSFRFILSLGVVFLTISGGIGVLALKVARTETAT